MSTAVKIIGVAALYALLAHIALAFFSANGVVSVVWPPSGLALAALLLGGKRYAWAVLTGAFAANAMTGLPVIVALSIAVGNTLEALLANTLLTRDGKFNPDIACLHDYLRLIVLGAGAGSVIAAVSGSTTLLLSGVFPVEAYLMNMIHWWMGDALGMILLTPLILVWRRPPDGWLRQKSMFELALLLGLSFLTGQIVFLDWFHDSFGLLARGYWMFLFVAFTSIYQGTHVAVIVIVMTAVQALLGAAQGTGYFADDIAKTELANFWFYMVV